MLRVVAKIIVFGRKRKIPSSPLQKQSFRDSARKNGQAEKNK